VDLVATSTAELERPPEALDKFRIFESIGYTPHAGQVPVHASRAPRRVLACGVRWGKTTCAAAEAVAASLQPSPPNTFRRGWIAAPTYDLSDKVFREVALIFQSRLMPFVVRVSEHERLALVQNMGGGWTEIRGKTAENPVSLLGEGLDWLIIDEASRVKPDTWERFLSARLLDKKGWALLISSPKGKGWFYDAWRMGQRKANGFESWNSPTITNPTIDAAELEAIRRRIPEAIYRQEYLAEFIEGAGAVFRNVRECATGDFYERDRSRTYVAGLDLARTEDYTVLTVLDDEFRVVFLDRFTRLDWAIQVDRVKTALEYYGKPPVLVDSTGAGEPIYESLLSAGVRAFPYQFTQKSKADLINNLALRFERREVRLPRREVAPELIDELESFQFTITDSGNVKTGAPSGYHDDCVISLALAAWELSNRPYWKEEPLDDW
jgi:hypothetical protein